MQTVYISKVTIFLKSWVLYELQTRSSCRHHSRAHRYWLGRGAGAEIGSISIIKGARNLDARLRRSMREEIRTLQQRLGLTVAYVTHDQSEALAVSDQIIVMGHGVSVVAAS